MNYLGVDRDLYIALDRLSDKALEDISSTLRSRRPIISEAWIALVDDKPCGCLMMDGHASEPTALEALKYYPKVSGAHGTFKPLTLLSELYNMGFPQTSRISWAATKFDTFVGRNGFFTLQDGIRVLNPEGRKVVRKMVTEIIAERKAQ